MLENIGLNQVCVNMPDVNEEEEHYIGVSFENKNKTTKDNPIFQEKMYEYKTTRRLMEGQLIYINTAYGKSLVCIRKPYIDEQDLQFKKEFIKEVEICQE